VGLDCGEVVGWYLDHRVTIVNMRQSKPVNETTGEKAGPGLARQGGRVTAIEGKRRGSKAWLFGAYTFLVLWGMAYLVLFFTDRLPF
jgi:hypothetical protein